MRGLPAGGGSTILFFVLGECGVEGAWGFSGVFHTTLFSCFVRWRGHRVTSRNSGLRFLLSMTHCNFPAPMGGSHLCRFGRPGFPTGGCLGAFDVDVTREGGLSLSISAIALASLSLSAVVLPMSSPSLVAIRDFCNATFFSNVWGGFC